MMKLYFSVFFTFCLSFMMIGQEFVNEIQIPPLAVSNNDGSYDLDAIQTMHNFNPKGSDSLNTMVPTYAFEDFNNPGTTSILGPTLTWTYKSTLSPTILNLLPEQTTCHWHGAHVPQSADGGPYQVIQPNELWSPTFDVLDKSATMWYHPHAMDLTYKHVQLGLSGMIIVEDPEDDPMDPTDDILAFIHEILPTDYGVDDFPLIFQTKKFERDVGTNEIIIQSEKGFKKDFYYMVNGIVDPYIILPADMVRLRMLNGDGKFSFNLDFEFQDGADFPAQMIATDAGYMDRTYQLPEILISPGERTEFLLDLRGLEGTELYVKNSVSTMPAGVIGNGIEGNSPAVDRNLLKIIIGPSVANQSPIIGFPIQLNPLETPPLSSVTNERTKVFRRDPFQVGNKVDTLFNIDSTLMDMSVVNDVVMLDATEIWTIENQTAIAHPWHIHDIHFWVTEVIDANGIPLIKNEYPQIFSGPKDNVLVQPGWKLSYITTFSDFGTEIAATNSYMYHCHILPHEDRGMMGTFVVWNGEGDPPVGVNDDPKLSSVPMSVFPNPAQDLVYLNGSSAKTSTLRILNQTGQLLKEMSLPSFNGAIEINTDQLPIGMAIMDWNTFEGKAVSRVMIIR